MHCGHRNFLLGREGMIETGHDAADWVNTKGENISDAAAEEEYPDAWWRECISRIPAVGDLWAYTVNGNEIFVHDYAGGSDEALEAIRRSKLSWRYLKACLGLREFSETTEQTRNEREALHHDLIAHDVRMIDEWTYIEEDFSEYEMIPVEEWEYAGRFNYLRFDLMGGTGGPENQWFADEVWIPDTVPTRSGFQFLGWAASADAAVAVCQPGDIYSADTDITLYAVWG